MDIIHKISKLTKKSKRDPKLEQLKEQRFNESAKTILYTNTPMEKQHNNNQNKIKIVKQIVLIL